MYQDVEQSAIVLVATSGVVERLHEVVAAGWDGPVVVVPTIAEAQELISGGEAQRPSGSGKAQRPTGGEQTQRPSGGEEAQRPSGGGQREVPRPRLMLDPDRQTVTAAGGEAPLTPLEFGLLRTLLEQPGRTHPFAELTEQVWRTRYIGDPAQVHSVVKRVRRKLVDIHSPLQVETVRGVGLRVLGS